MTFHPDHLAVSRWVTAAWRERGSRSRLFYATFTSEHLSRFGELYEEWNTFMSDERPSGVPADQLDIHVRLRGSQLDRKLTALEAMASQTRELVGAIGEATYAALVDEEAFVDAAEVVQAGYSQAMPSSSLPSRP
jgi:LmbE family N-acetylglucosaminyl deacetylase